MSSLFRRASGLALLLAVVSASADTPDPGDFARLARDASGAPRAFQTAIVTYAPAGEAPAYTVDLIGAVHVGDRAYYADLNERFTGYDALLFEMVVPDEKPARDDKDGGAGGLGVISLLQNGMKEMLGLTYQLDEIDYGAPNFVHADLSARGLRDSMEAREESLYVYFWRVVYASFDEYARDPLGTRDLQIMAALLTSGRDERLKVVIAEELLTSMESGDIFAGADGSAIIAARNEHAIGVLRQQIDAGTRRIGIFYGVAHLPDFDERLREELGLVRTRTEWVDAWRFGAVDPP